MEQHESINPNDYTKSLTREDVLVDFRKNNIDIVNLLLSNPRDPVLGDLLEFDDYLGTLLSNFRNNNSNPDFSQTPLS